MLYPEMVSHLSQAAKALRKQMLEQASARCTDGDPCIVDHSFNQASISVAWILCEPLGDHAKHYSVWLLQQCETTPRLVFEETVLPAEDSKPAVSCCSQCADLEHASPGLHPIDHVAVDGNTVLVRDRRKLKTRDLSWAPAWLQFKRDNAQPLSFEAYLVSKSQDDRETDQPFRRQSVDRSLELVTQ